MALLLCNINLAAPYSSLPIFKTHHKRHRFKTTNNLKPRLSLPNPPNPSSPKRVLLPPLKSASSINGFSIQNAPEVSRDRRNAELFERVRRWIASVRTVLPGGSWWSFSDDVDVKLLAKPVTVLQALVRMWHLVAQDRWVIFTAFATLIVAALAQIAIPHYLTASIFTAQSSEVAVFHRNVRLLIVLCITSGICRSKSLVSEVAALALQI